MLGFRWPGAWAVVFLTKITPGIGVLWFAFRREWRSFAIALGVTAAVTAVSFALNPQWWAEFREAMTVQAGAAMEVPPAAIQISLPVRLVLAVVVVVLRAPAPIGVARPGRRDDRGAGALVERVRDPRRLRAAARGPRADEAADRPCGRSAAPRARRQSTTTAANA